MCGVLSVLSRCVCSLNVFAHSVCAPSVYAPLVSPLSVSPLSLYVRVLPQRMRLCIMVLLDLCVKVEGAYVPSLYLSALFRSLYPMFSWGDMPERAREWIPT